MGVSWWEAWRCALVVVECAWCEARLTTPVTRRPWHPIKTPHDCAVAQKTHLTKMRLIGWEIVEARDSDDASFAICPKCASPVLTGAATTGTSSPMNRDEIERRIARWEKHRQFCDCHMARAKLATLHQQLKDQPDAK